MRSRIGCARSPNEENPAKAEPVFRVGLSCLCFDWERLAEALMTGILLRRTFTFWRLLIQLMKQGTSGYSVSYKTLFASYAGRCECWSLT